MKNKRNIIFICRNFDSVRLRENLLVKYDRNIDRKIYFYQSNFSFALSTNT